MSSQAAVQAKIEHALQEAEETCSSPWVADYATKLPSVSITFHELLIILGIVACVVNCLIAVYLICGHLYHWVKPNEQRQILRITLWIPITSLCSLFSIYFYHAEGHIYPVTTSYEGFAVVALFLLYMEYICPIPTERASYFNTLERRNRSGKKPKGDKGSLQWYRATWIRVFQILFFLIASTVTSWVLIALTCPLDSIRRTVKMVISIVQGLSTFVAVLGIVMFERRFQHQLSQHHGLLKLWSFKAIVIIKIIQNILFDVHSKTGVFKPTPPYHISWNDFTIGLPEFILIWEMTVVVMIFLQGYDSKAYKEMVYCGTVPVTPTWKAFLTVLDPRDVFSGVWYVFTCFTSSTFLEGPVSYQSLPVEYNTDEENKS